MRAGDSISLGRLVAPLAIAASAWGIAVAPSASGTESADVYVRGTTRMASFASRATCDRIAASELQKVTSDPQVARLLGPWPYGGYPDAKERLTCYPVQGARWSYVIAYEALSGKALSRNDVLYPREGTVTLDVENVWAFTRYRSYATVKACNRAFESVVARVEEARNRKLGFGTHPCITLGPGTVAFTINYLATTSTGGLSGDTPYSQTINILNQNGWAVPYA